MTTATKPQIVWECQECHKPITGRDSDGYVMVDLNEVFRWEKKYADWKQRHPGRRVSGEALMDIPRQVPWMAVHHRCAPDGDDVLAHWIEVDRAETVGDLLRWTLHLAEAGWIEATDWVEFCGAAASRAGVRNP